jgi:hypothetical protein
MMKASKLIYSVDFLFKIAYSQGKRRRHEL